MDIQQTELAAFSYATENPNPKATSASTGREDSLALPCSPQ